MAAHRSHDEKLMLVLEAENTSFSGTARRHGIRRASLHEWKRALNPVEPLTKTIARLEKAASALVLASLLRARKTVGTGLRGNLLSETEMLHARFHSITAYEECLQSLLRLVDDSATSGSISAEVALILLLSVWSPMSDAMKERSKILTRLDEIRGAKDGQERRHRFDKVFEDALIAITQAEAKG